MNRVLIVLLTAVLALTLPVQAIAGSAPARKRTYAATRFPKRSRARSPIP